MKFDFTTIYDRMGKDALAVENVGKEGWGPDQPGEGFDFIPMWVADMNFATCPAVTEAIIERVKHPLFGYYRPRPEYFERIIGWQSGRNGYTELRPEHIGYENGVHGCVTSAVTVLTQPGDAVLLHRPTYIGFAADIDRQGRVPVYSDLVKDEQGVYRMNFEEMDRLLTEHQIRVVVFCSPHNPTGRVWERWELEQAMAIFERHGCTVISDEIWSDIVYPGHRHIPTPLVSPWAREHTVAAYALSKTFNLAAMCGSYHIICGDELREKVVKRGDRTNYNSQHVLTQHALLGAYSETGSEWVAELLTVLEANCRSMADFLNGIEGVHVTMPEGTYMLFADLTDYCARTGKTQEELLKAAWAVGVGWQDGKPFGGPCHVRINVALPFSRVQEAEERLRRYVLNQ